MNNLLAETIVDLNNDFLELLYLCQNALTSLREFNNRFKKNQKYLLPETNPETANNLIRTEQYFSKQKLCIEKSLKEIRGVDTDKKKALLFIQEKNNIFDSLRNHYGYLGALITSVDWQSPSSAFSLTSQAGVQTGRIEATFNDYKRDHHLDQKTYEKLFIKEYVQAKNKKSWRTLTTSSGMSAFTTILNFLAMEGKLQKKVLLGKSSYFQYKQLVIKLLPQQVIEVDEGKIDEIIAVINKQKPGVIFLDSLCNSKFLAVPDLDKLADYLTTEYQKEIYLVVDNTGRTITFDLWDKSNRKNKDLHLIVFESLIKYLQFGLDRVNGGIIVAKQKDLNRLFEYRKNLGTNIADFAVYLLPLPNKPVLQKRLARFQRNADLLTRYLDNYITNNKTCLEKIIYPGLLNHDAYTSTKEWPFRGCFFNLKFKQEYETTSFYKKFIRLLLANSKKSKLQLVAGTSFGLNQTRVYLTSLWSDFGDPFLRISLGIETRFEIEALEKVFSETIEQFYSFVPPPILLGIKKTKQKLKLDKIM